MAYPEDKTDSPGLSGPFAVTGPSGRSSNVAGPSRSSSNIVGPSGSSSNGAGPSGCSSNIVKLSSSSVPKRPRSKIIGVADNFAIFDNMVDD